jgi:hypothetical protein
MRPMPRGRSQIGASVGLGRTDTSRANRSRRSRRTYPSLARHKPSGRSRWTSAAMVCPEFRVADLCAWTTALPRSARPLRRRVRPEYALQCVR